MVFSLFRRQDKSASRKGRQTGSVAANNSSITSAEGSGVVNGVSSQSLDQAEHAAREAARITAEKIDQIENEMIADALTGITKPGAAATPDSPESGAESRNTNASASASASATSAVPEQEPLEFPSKDAATQTAATQTGGPDTGMSFKPTAVQLLQAISDKENGIDNPIHHLPDPATDLGASTAMAPLSVAPEAGLESDATEEADPANGATTVGGRRSSEAEDDLAIDIVDGSLPGQLEEAAILYSNGQYQATVDTLSACLDDDGLSKQHQLLSWQMLFDLLQVMGEREQFDSLAIKYASLTESSPPTWNEDMRAPDRRKSDRRASPSNIAALREIDGTFAKFVDQLLRAAGNKRDCCLDLSGVRQMDDEAAQEICRLFNGFLEADHKLSLTGVEAFLELVLTNIEVGRVDDSEAFWQLSLLLLRLLGEQARFDDLSIDYCVTFEVSPPPWEPMPPIFVLTDEISAGAAKDAGDETPAVIRKAEISNNRLILRDDLSGKIQAEKEAMQSLAETNSTVRVDCRALRCMDFSAAGELLNELAAMMGRGRKVQFIEPNFLVYALMLVMGIHEMSEIRRRKI